MCVSSPGVSSRVERVPGWIYVSCPVSGWGCVSWCGGGERSRLSTYLFSFTPRHLSSRILKPTREIVIIQSKKWKSDGRFWPWMLNRKRYVRVQTCFNTGVKKYFDSTLLIIRGTRFRIWLWHCATNRKFAASIPHATLGYFHWHNPLGHNMALGSTQLPKELSMGNISWG
jgi:hypothetical protein